jgi:L-ascorbate metabolism protein UlaG (beta-lactamase superfamily)
MDQLPPIDVILISHNHYDHLDMPTMIRLFDKHRPLVLTGLGNASLLKESGISKVKELDWWQHRNIKDLKLFFVPAQHFSGRGVSDRDKTLWGGFVIQTRYGNVYFAGDTAYGRFLNLISEKFGPMFLSFLPIGAFEPRWFMRPYHFDPGDAVRAHLDLESARSVGIHFGTFKLSLEGVDVPSRLLKSRCYDFDVDENHFHAPEFGVGYELTV